jgi:hypothetical protein
LTTPPQKGLKQHIFCNYTLVFARSQESIIVISLIDKPLTGILQNYNNFFIDNKDGKELGYLPILESPFRDFKEDYLLKEKD